MRKVSMSEKGLRVLRGHAEKRKQEKNLSPQEATDLAEALRESFDRLAEAKDEG